MDHDVEVKRIPWGLRLKLWGERLIHALTGLSFGILLALLGAGVLYGNEGRFVSEAGTLLEGAAAVLSVSADRMEPGNEGKLVHISGVLETPEMLSDPEFGVSLQALRLKRSVEMYQWIENTEEYHAEWSSLLVSSADFRVSAGHTNPASMPYEPREWRAEAVWMGTFRVPEELVEDLSDFKIVAVTLDERLRLPEGIRSKVLLSGQGYYYGEDTAIPRIGDLRISFEAVYPETATIVAEQAGESFRPYRTKAGGTLFAIAKGNRTAIEIFPEKEQGIGLRKWILRFTGFLLIWVGFILILKRLVARFGAAHPLIESFVGMRTAIPSVFLALPLSLSVIAVAWIFLRPYSSAVILIVAAALLGWGIIRGVRKKRVVQPAAL